MNNLYKVLIVDDEMLIRQGIINYIEWEHEGFKIIGEASNGEEALPFIMKYQPEIMITDIVMPGMNGIELIKKVKEVAPKTEIIVLSSFEDFDYVRQTFQYGVADYILKPKLNTDELLNTLYKITTTLAINNDSFSNKLDIEDVLRKIIEGYQSFGEIDTLKKHFTYHSFILIELFWKDKPPEKHTEKKLKTMLKQKLTHCHSYTFSIHANHLLLVVNVDEFNQSKLNDLLMQFPVEYSQAYKEVKWLVSEPFTEIHTLKGIYDLFQNKLHRYHFYLPERSLITVDDLPTATSHPFKFDLNHMIKLFQQYHFQKAFDYLTKHIHILSTHYDTDVFEFKSWLENIIFNIIVLLGNMEYDVKRLNEEKYYYFSKINDAFHVGEAIETFEGFLTEVKGLTVKTKSGKTSNMQLLLYYIDEHYNEPLSLKILADHFYFNPSYLSSYFSKHHKEGFNEYLNHIRIKKAKDLLINTNLPISTISEKVGYSEPSYFTKVFKKLLNQSPRNYRTQATQKE